MRNVTSLSASLNECPTDAGKEIPQQHCGKINSPQAPVQLVPPCSH